MADKKNFPGFSRRNLLKAAGVGAFLATGIGDKLITGKKAGAEEVSNITAEKALEMLTEGNQRYVEKKLSHPHQTGERILEVAKVQHPFAAILGCADSRVVPEIIFDQGIGDLFVQRVAGNIVDDAIAGSIEYAVEELGVPLLIVLGHERCGAVTAAIKGGQVPGHISTLIDAIKPVVEKTKSQPGDMVDNAVRANVKFVVEKLSSYDDVVSELVKSGKLKIVGGRYDLDTGKVDIIA